MAQTVLLFANNARSTVSGSITAVATSVTLATGTGVLFPNPNNAIGEYFKLTFTDQATGLINEIVHGIAVVGDVVTIVRAQEGTTALAWNAGDFAVNMWTKNSANAMLQAPQVQNNTINSVTAGGTSDAITATYAPVYAAWVDGMTFFAKITAANTTTTPTISPNGLTAKTIVKINGVALKVGDLAVGMIAEFKYSSTLDKVLLQNPATQGGLINYQIFSTVGTATYTPTAGTNYVIVEAVGGGGAGGSCSGASAGNAAAGGGGVAGAYGKGKYTSAFSGVTVTVGAGGTPGTAGNQPGGNGGTTSFGALLSCPGGTGGGGGLAASTSTAIGVQGSSSNGSAPTGANILAITGMGGLPGYIFQTGNLTGRGGDSPYGTSGRGYSGSQNGIAATGYGAGGSGGGDLSGSATPRQGGAGAQGVVIVWEYS